MIGTDGRNWRTYQDDNKLYQLDHQFNYEHLKRSHIDNLILWKEKDLKGKRKTFYMKEITKQNDLILNVTEQSRLEKLQNFEDRWPCLNFRKKLQKVRIYINLAASTIIEHKAFEGIAISVILCNSVSLAVEDPTQVEQTALSMVIENVFLGCYTLEMILKIIGLGFLFNKGAYLRDSWNILDFVIVMSAFFTIGQDEQKSSDSSGGGLQLSGLRAFRVLRPLRTITSIKGLKVLVRSVLSALPLLKDTIIVLCFFFLVFAIGGTQLFMGLLKQVCVDIETGTAHEDILLCGGRAECPDGYFCGKQNMNPNYGNTNFDNIFYSLLAVFQCITLEGWSDIQKQYMKTYNDMVFLFFVPLVFIGAFFLLNLTLVVINTSFSQTQREASEVEAAAKAAKRKVQKAEQRGQKAEMEHDGERPHDIGVSEFFLAKRAAKKMIEFLRQRQMQKALDENVEGEDGEAKKEGIVSDNTLSEPVIQVRGTTPGSATRPQALTDRRSTPNDTNHKPNEVNRTITEEHDEDDDNHSAIVAKFLKDLQANLESSDPRVEGTAADNDIRMAQNDLRRAQAKYTEHDPPKIQTALNKKIDLNQPEQSKIFNGKINNIAELGFDQVVAKDGLRKSQPEKLGPKHKKQEVSEDSGDHPFDLSFVGSIQHDYPDYLSDDNRQKSMKSFDDLQSSAIESDESFNSQLAHLRKKQAADQQKHVKRTMPKPFKDDFKNLRFKRQQSQKLRDGNSNKESDGASTKFNGDIKSELSATNPGNTPFKLGPNKKKKTRSQISVGGKDANTTQSQVPTNTHQRKKAVVDAYNNIDDTFLKSSKPKDPYEFIDRKTQKIEINPKMPYRSSSQDEVFQIRTFLKEAQDKTCGNAFVKSKMVEKDPDEYRATEFYKPKFDAFQLKCRYKIDKKEEIDFDSDDEDTLILALQPYDTVMNAAYAYHLTHLPTRFVARRSDIIVSSTISITLTPKDNNYKPLDIVKLNDEEIKEWVDKRQEFRSKGVKTVTAAENFKPNSDTLSMRSQPLSVPQSRRKAAFGSENDQKSPSDSEFKLAHLKDQTLNRAIIPQSLLSEPLSQKLYQCLNEEEKRLYNFQKTKYEATMRQIKKMERKPQDMVFQMSDANLLFEGKYHDNDDEEEPLDLLKNTNDSPWITSRQETARKMQEFEQAALAIVESRSSSLFQTKLQKDEIPQEIRDEFELPDDMATNLIDFEEVRRKDNSFKRKTPLWSGQDVMEISFQNDSAEWVISRLNKVRVWPKGGMGALKRIRFSLKKIVRSAFFDNFMTFSVLVNTVTMAMDRYNMPEAEQYVLNYLNTVFTWIFICEMTTKLLAIGVKKYCADKMNYLDGSVVLLSIIEMVFMSGGSKNGSLSAFRTVRIFRTFRVLRVARLLRALHSMQVIIGVIQRSISSFVYISILLFVFVFIYALLGMQIFGGNFNFPEGKPRGNYDSFNIAFVTVFQILTMENWQTVLFDSMRSSLGPWIPAAFYISWIFIGNFILLNLFLAILLDSFLTEDEETEITDDMLEAERQAQEARRQLMLKEKERRMRKMGTSMMRTYNKTAQVGELNKQKTKNLFHKKMEDDVLIDDIDELDENAIKDIFVDQGLIKNKNSNQKNMFLSIECENSMYLFSQKNRFRKTMCTIYKHKYFDNFIMVLIVLSSLKLAVDTFYLDADPDSLLMQISNNVDLCFTIAFTIESVIKMISMGLLMDRGSYLRESWNILDAFIVFSSLVDLMLTNVDIPAIKILRLLRTLRPLRFISHNVAMKMIVVALLESVGAIFNVMIVVVVVWLMFAIFGVNMFQGKFQYCTVGIYKYHTKIACNSNGGSWKRYDSNFDDILQAMMTLFITASLEGWPDIMLQAVDVVGEDKGPAYENSPENAYFFLIFILIGSYFFLNFFIGVLFLKYTQAQREETKGYTQAHLNWIDIQQMIIKAQVPHDVLNEPEAPWRKKVWKVARSNAFDLMIMACIILNMAQMSCSFEGAPDNLLLFLRITNYIFTSVFFLEAAIKLISYGWSYFHTAWNKFDFFVVVASLLDIALEFMSTDALSFLSVGPQLARVMRVLRVSRVLRLAGKSEGLQALLTTITMSISSLMNVFGLLMLIFFMLAILGVFFFRGIIQGDVLDDYKNFNNFAQGFLLLFVISTGEDWNKIMYDCMKTPPNCVPGLDCGSSWAPVYFIVFNMLVTNVMLNLFILVIIQQFESYYVSDDNPISKFKTNLNIFMTTWIHFTHRFKCVRIREKQLFYFFKKLPPPIGMPENTSEAEMKKQMLKMGIRCEDGFIFFNELLYRCMRRQYGNFKLNKKMQIIELKTQYKLYLLTSKYRKGSRTGNQGDTFISQMIDVGQAVNPFLTTLYFQISFKAWLSSSRQAEARKLHEKDMEEKKAIAEAAGLEFTPSPFDDAVGHFQEVTIEEEINLEFTSEEDEENTVQEGSRAVSQRNGSQFSDSQADIERNEARKRRRKSQRLQLKSFSVSKRSQNSGPSVAMGSAAKSQKFLHNLFDQDIGSNFGDKTK